MRDSAARKAPLLSHTMPHALRLRLVFWYGLLMTATLLAFGTLLVTLASNALNQSVITSTTLVGRAALADVERQLRSTPPYLPTQPGLNDIDPYRTPMVIAILAPDGHAVYSSSGSQLRVLPRDPAAWQGVLHRQEQWYTTTVNGDRLYVGMLPICLSATGALPSTATQPTSTGTTPSHICNGTLVGVLLVAKSFNDVDNILLLLKTLLVIASTVILIAALAGGWLIVTHVLRPLAGVVATARAITEATARGTRIGNLSLRVPQPHRRDEIALVIDSFNAMLSDLEHAVRAQHRFVADASHELRAPLTTIQGNLAFLQRYVDELPPEERRTMLSDAHSETLRLARLVDDLLLLARADASVSLPPQTEEMEELPSPPPVVELDRIVLQLIRQLRLRLNAEDSPLKLEIGHMEAVRVRGEEEQLRRLLLILLDNALKYTPADSEQQPGRVIVSLERTESEALLRVSDTGIGIDPADLPHIFERFYRADRARKRQGTGLGLAIAHTLVEQLGGRISAESVPGEGSTFSVWLPIAPSTP
jgi:two-component system OmpR family sensor kinase